MLLKASINAQGSYYQLHLSVIDTNIMGGGGGGREGGNMIENLTCGPLFCSEILWRIIFR